MTVDSKDSTANERAVNAGRSIGSPVLMGLWTDPDFDPAQEAYYYVRVLQLPTARWTLYDEIREGVTYPDDVKRQIVERAWGSPVWYEVN